MTTSVRLYQLQLLRLNSENDLGLIAYRALYIWLKVTCSSMIWIKISYHVLSVVYLHIDSVPVKCTYNDDNSQCDHFCSCHYDSDHHDVDR